MAMALVAQPAWFDDEEDCHANLIGEEYKMKLKQDETVSKFQTNYWMQGQGIDWKAFESAKFLREIYRSCEWAPPITAGRNILVNSGDPILMHIASYLFGGKGAYGTYHEVLIYAFNLRGISKKHRLVFDWEKVAGVVTRGGTLAALKEEVRQEKRLVVRKTDALSVDSEYQTTKIAPCRTVKCDRSMYFYRWELVRAAMWAFGHSLPRLQRRQSVRSNISDIRKEGNRWYRW